MRVLGLGKEGTVGSGVGEVFVAIRIHRIHRVEVGLERFLGSVAEWVTSAERIVRLEG